MANYTENLNLKKPLQTEFYDVDDFNENADKIDAFAKNANAHIADKENPHETTADKTKASKMFTYGETNKYATVLDACNALKYGGGFVASSYAPMSSASDYPKPGFELVFNVIGEANEARKTVIAYGYRGGKMNIFQRDIFREQWETNWKSTDESYLSLSGGTLSGGVKINNGIGSFGAIDQYLSLAHVDSNSPSNYRNLSVSNTYDIDDSLILHEVRNGVEVATYRIFGEHNKHLMGVSYIGTTASYYGTGLNTYDSTTKKYTSEVELSFTFPAKFLFMGRRTFVAKGTGQIGTTEDAYHYVNTVPINIEALLLNEYDGKSITTKVPLQAENNNATMIVSADRKTITITSDNAIQGMNEPGGYYYYTAIG
jgi:hypothetical protein